MFYNYVKLYSKWLAGCKTADLFFISPAVPNKYFHCCEGCFIFCVSYILFFLQIECCRIQEKIKSTVHETREAII